MSITTITALKNGSYVVAVASVFTWLDLDPSAMAALAALIVLDVITGILKSGLLRGWRSVTSSRLQCGLCAKLLLMIVPLSLAIMCKGAGIDCQNIAQATIVLMLISEVYSIIANIIAIRTREDQEEFDLMTLALRKIQAKLRFLFDNPSNNDKRK